MDWEAMFGGEVDALTLHAIEQHDWSYTPVDNEERDKIILDLSRRVSLRDFSMVGENIGRWEKGWKENLDEYRQTGNLNALNPKYLKPAKYLRLDSQFIAPGDPRFETNWYRVFRGWFARRYLAQYDAIYEFGCGSGHNVAFLAQEFPGKQIIGLDWTDASFEIMHELARRFPNVAGGRFDFFSPAHFEFPRNSAVLTIGALEQTGVSWRSFLDFLHNQKPAMCFHIEPIVEWYDWDNLVDHTAIEIHRARGFQRGFVNKIESVRQHRTRFGSYLLEGYSQLQWKP